MSCPRTWRRPSSPSSATTTTGAITKPWETSHPPMSSGADAKRSYDAGRRCKSKRSNGEDSTTGQSGSLQDLHKTPDLSGLKVCQVCWLPTVPAAEAVRLVVEPATQSVRSNRRSVGYEQTECHEECGPTGRRRESTSSSTIPGWCRPASTSSTSGDHLV